MAAGASAGASTARCLVLANTATPSARTCAGEPVGDAAGGGAAAAIREWECDRDFDSSRVVAVS